MTRTNVYTLLCVVIRAIAVWSVLRLGVGLPAMVVAKRNTLDNGAGDGFVYVFFAAIFVLAVLAWIFADKIARLTLARPQGQVFESDLDAGAWLGVFLGAIGAWQLFAALVDGAYLGSTFLIASAIEATGVVVRHDYYPQMISICFKAFLGFALLLRGQGIAGLIHRLRTAGNMGDAR